jgi:tRNA (guanine-N7-)-methyltransferase
MGRRALRKVDPALDLSRHFREGSELPAAFDPLSLFGRAAPLEVEVGSGKGLFLAGAARHQPERDFLGVEVARKYARFAAARLAKQGSDNAIMIRGDALVLFGQWFEPGSLAAVHVYFPDPWWKKRHKKRRVMNEQFLRDVERTLGTGGRLHFWTDVEEYFRTTLELIAATVKLKGPLAVEEQPAQHDLDYRTHFERRTRRNELPVYRAEYEKP